MSSVSCPVWVAASLLTSTVALAVPQASLFVKEVIVPPDYPYSPYEQLIVDREGPTNFYHPRAPFFTGNSRAYANATDGKIGARAIAARDPSHGAVSGGTPIPTYAYDRREVTVDVNYRDTLKVASGSLPLNSPVKLGLTLRLDGSIYSGPLKADPLSTHSTGSMNAFFRVIDNALIGGEGGSPLVSFSAQAATDKFTYRSGENKLYTYSEDARWTLETPDDYQSVTVSDLYVERPYPENPSVGLPGDVPFPQDRLDFDTGVMNLVINTYVGATLDISSSIVLTGFATDNSPTVILDFMNTLSSSFTLLDGGDVTITKTSATWPTESIPEPTSMLGMMAALPLLTRRRR